MMRAKRVWHGVPRISLPGLLISRAVQAVTDPLVMAGPELDKRLQPHVERLCGISNPSRSQRWLRDALLWLLEERDTWPEETECSARASAALPACDPVQPDLLQGTQRYLWEHFGIAEASVPRPRPQQGTSVVLPARQAEEAQGAR